MRTRLWTGGNIHDEAVEVILQSVFLIVVGTVVFLMFVEFNRGERSFGCGGFVVKVIFHGR